MVVKWLLAFAVVLWAAGFARSGTLDPLEELLSGKEPTLSIEPQKAGDLLPATTSDPRLDSTASFPAAGHEDLPARHEQLPVRQELNSHWSQPRGAVLPEAGSAGPHRPIAREPESPASPLSAVPEPSAILLALAALGYFLLFGRRRRVI